MSIESTRDVMMSYWNRERSDSSMLADDVVFTMIPTGEEWKTPEGVLELLYHFYNVAFDAGTEVEHSLIGDGHAMVEGQVIGKHIGEFAGIPGTGKDIRVPMCVSYDVVGDKIQRARIYFEVPVLLKQLGLA